MDCSNVLWSNSRLLLTEESTMVILGAFLFYFLLFIFIFASPERIKKQNTNGLLKMLVIPAVIALFMLFLSVLKVYFIYKILVFLFLIFTFLLSYWQWGEKLRKWF